MKWINLGVALARVALNMASDSSNDERERIDQISQLLDLVEGAVGDVELFVRLRKQAKAEGREFSEGDVIALSTNLNTKLDELANLTPEQARNL